MMNVKIISILRALFHYYLSSAHDCEDRTRNINFGQSALEIHIKFYAFATDEFLFQLLLLIVKHTSSL